MIQSWLVIMNWPSRLRQTKHFALGTTPVVIGTSIEGEACHVAGVYVSMAQYLSQQNNRGVPYAMSSLPAAIIGGGETTVTLPIDRSLEKEVATKNWRSRLL